MSSQIPALQQARFLRVLRDHLEDRGVGVGVLRAVPDGNVLLVYRAPALDSSTLKELPEYLLGFYAGFLDEVEEAGLTWPEAIMVTAWEADSNESISWHVTAESIRRYNTGEYDADDLGRLINDTLQGPTSYTHGQP